ncbi:MAG: hypothetical protein ABIQ44_09885 [Chloroflexia bacterium]
MSNIVAATVGVRPIWMTFVGPLVAVVACLVMIKLNVIERVQQVTQSVCGSWVVNALVEQPPGMQLYDVGALAAVGSDDIWVAGGRSRTQVGIVEPYLLHWDGKEATFVQVDDPTQDVSRINDLAAVSANDIWAVGVGQSILHWNGLTWRSIQTGIYGSLNGISALARDDIWAVGSEIKSGNETPLLMHWDGKQWSRVAEPDGINGFIELYDVSMIAHDNVYAVGKSTEGELALQWKGDKWYKLAPLLDRGASFYNEGCSGEFGAFASVGVNPDSLWVVGDCSKRSIGDLDTWHLTSAMSTELYAGNY